MWESRKAGGGNLESAKDEGGWLRFVGSERQQRCCIAVSGKEFEECLDESRLWIGGEEGRLW